MASARMATQLVCSTPSRIGLLADIAGALREKGVNISALSAYERDGEGKFLMITDDNAKATEALERFGIDVREKSVVIAEMSNEVGALERAAKAIAEAGVNIEYAYATAPSAGHATVVFKTDDDTKTFGILA